MDARESHEKSINKNNSETSFFVNKHDTVSYKENEIKKSRYDYKFSDFMLSSYNRKMGDNHD